MTGHLHRDHERQLIEVAKKLNTKSMDLDKREADITRRELVDSLNKRAKPEEAPAESVAIDAPPRVEKPTYIDLKGRVWEKAGWVEHDQRWWDFRSRHSIGGRLLRVGTPSGSTTAKVGSATWVRVGCVICGVPQTVEDKVAIGKWKDGPWRGFLCMTCHRSWIQLGISDRNDHDSVALWVTDRLEQEGYLPDVEREREERVSPTYTRIHRLYLQRWASKTWAYRVLTSDRPEIQRPPARSFGYLAKPIRIGEIEKAKA